MDITYQDYFLKITGSQNGQISVINKKMGFASLNNFFYLKNIKFQQFETGYMKYA